MAAAAAAAVLGGGSCTRRLRRCPAPAQLMLLLLPLMLSTGVSSVDTRTADAGTRSSGGGALHAGVSAPEHLREQQQAPVQLGRERSEDAEQAGQYSALHPLTSKNVPARSVSDESSAEGVDVARASTENDGSGSGTSSGSSSGGAARRLATTRAGSGAEGEGGEGKQQPAHSDGTNRSSSSASTARHDGISDDPGVAAQRLLRPAATAATPLPGPGPRPQQQNQDPDAKQHGVAAAEEADPMVVVVPPYEQFRYDIAMSTGSRPQYGATFSTCLVGLMASGAMGAARRLHLLLSDGSLLARHSLLYNLAHMPTAVRLSLYDMEGGSRSMRARNVFYQLLLTPDLPAPSGPATPPSLTTVADAATAVAKDRTRSSGSSTTSTTSGTSNQVKGPAAATEPAGRQRGEERLLQAAEAGVNPVDSDRYVGSDGGGGGGDDSDPHLSNLPTLLLEDDVWPVDDFPRKLHDVVAQAARRTRGGPFAIKLYLSTSIPSAAAAGTGSSSPGPSSSSNARSIRSSKSAAGGAGSNRKKGGSMKFGTLPEIRRLHALTCSNVQPTSFGAVLAAGHAAGARAGRRDEPGGVGRAVMVSVNASSPERYRIKPRTYKWGAQGLYLSDGRLRRRLAACFLQYTDQKYERQRRYKDWPLKMCLGELSGISPDQDSNGNSSSSSSSGGGINGGGGGAGGPGRHLTGKRSRGHSSSADAATPTSNPSTSTSTSTGFLQESQPHQPHQQQPPPAFPRVAVFDSGRSLLQHVGAASSLFGGAADNGRYHRACSFPFLEKLPAEDEPGDWI